MAEENRKQLAQRLYPRDPSASRKRVVIRSTSTLKARALPTLSNFKPNSNVRSSSSIKKARLLDPISPYIKNRGMTPLPLEKLRGETPIPDFDPISLTDRRFPKEELVTKSLATTRTRAKKRHMHGDLSFTKFDGSYVNLKAKRPTPFDFLEIIRSDPELKDDFWYCNRVGGSYEFEFVRFADKNPHEYLTISSRGVTHFVNGEAEFMTLGEWEREYRLYARVKDIKFFKQYKLWKNFSLWKNIRRRNMIRDRAQFLREQLFLLDNRLREPMLNVRTIGYRVAKMDVIDYSFDTIRTVKTFEADQEEKRNLVSNTIYNIEKDVLGIVVTACKTSMDDFRKENKARNVEDDEAQDPFLIGDSTRRQMPFTQEAIVRTHYRKLAKFIRLCEFHILDAKVTLAYSSAQRLLETVTFEYSKSSKESAGATLRKQHQPLWRIDVNFEGLKMIYEPMPDQLKALLDDTFAKVMKILLKSYILIYSPELEKYSKSLEELEDKHLEEEFDIYQLIITEEEMLRKEESIRKGVDSAFYRVYTYCKRYQRCLEIYKQNENMDLNYFRTVDSDIVKEAIDTYYQEEKEFKALEESVNLGLFQLDLKDMKHKLIPSPKLCITKLENFLPQHSLQKAADLVKELNDENRLLAITPQNVKDYVEHLKNVRSIEGQLTDFNLRFNDIKDNMQLMEGYGIRFSDDVRQKYNDTVQALNLLHQRVSIFYERDENNKIRFSRELRDKMGQVDKRNKALKERLSDPRISDKNAQTGELVGLLKNIGEDVEQLYNDTQDYNIFARELDIERVSFAAVVDLRRDYKLKADMWNSLHEWTYKTMKWNSTSFGVIDVDGISKEVDHYYRIAQRSRVLEEEGNFVPQVLRAKVEALKDTMPVVTDLRCKALKPRHWEQLCQIIGAQVDINDPNFTLEDLLDSEVNDKRDEISEVALRARKEEELEKQLNDVVSGWDGQEFHFKYDREKDYYIFKDIDEIQTKLEDTQVVLSTIMANRFIGPLYERVDHWNKKFALFAATFDEWLICQKSWAELEKIFSSPDIAKQMHDKTKKFNQINVAFKELMRSTSERPDALEAATRPSLLVDLRSWNERLERLQKDLEEYLDRKRKLFGRFFFLSNEELLTILSNSQKPDSIQPHLRNMFENIYSIRFSSDKPEDVEEMISIEGEAVNLGKNLKARGNVEEWLGNLDISMQRSIKRELKNGYIKFATKARKSWVLKHPAQIVSTISMVMWSFSTEEAIANHENNQDAVYEWYDACVSNLNELTTVVRSKLTDIQRKSVIALVTQTVHSRDVVAALRQIEGISLNHFKWQQQLRYYWEADNEDVILRQMNGVFEYGNEFMGATTRLVITPLTDRCWLTITGALSMKLGAAPAGPAGTGKTESTKDLAKAMGRYCVVFNCSEQVTYQMMEKLFMGLCYTGAWTCLDEFNRIDIEVLSVIASQLRIIRKARLEERSEFIFEDKLIKLVHSMGVFITMNPGYAGRVELPDNLKVLFRPVSMMVPDYTLIAEIMLYAEGFSDAKELSVKMTKLYKLSSEQLSQQDHYDFGMRAVKSVLNMAGALKRKEPHLKEDVILIRAMKESNIPKFLHDDIILFDAIVQDLFPSVKIPAVDSGSLESSISSIISLRNLQSTSGFIEKTLQLYNLLSVRFGVMIVGPATAGKTTCYTTLAQSLTHLHDQYRSDAYSKVIYSVLNPKAITMGELYGEFNDITQEWKDGLASSLMRDFARSETKEQKWLVFDGPVDSLWIENMNTVLDDNMTLCLGNGERIKLRNNMRMVFEVLDLAAASPATVSRCGMVYMNIEAVGWKPIVKSWIERELEDWQQQAKDHLWLLFSAYIDKALSFIRRGLNEPIPTMNNSLVQSICNIIRALTRPRVCPRLRDDFEYFKKYIDKIFLFAVTWGLGGALDISSAKRFDHRFCADYSNDLPKGSLYDSFVDPSKKCGEYKPWETITPPYQYDPEVSFSDILVHTSDTTKFAYLIKLGVTELKPVFITGYTGVGKSVIVSNTLASLKEKESIYPVYMTFSARTSSSQTQNSILSKLDSKRKDLYGAPGANKAVLVIDDVNMPSVEQYGAQPPIELMRQLCDGGYFFEREKLFKIKVIDTTVICCAAPPEGGRHPLTYRFTRHFHILCIPPANEDTLSSIYRQILEGFLKPFKPEVQALLNHIVSSTITLYNTLSKELLPIPAKTHYIFNTRDVSKVFQGILMSSAKNYTTPDSMIKLWIHENMRVFHDRLINKEDRNWFTKNIVRMLILYFRRTVTHEELFEESPPVIFGDFVKGDLDVEDREYIEFPSMEYLAKKVSEFISDYNYSNSIHINLVLFQDALEHLARICRILRQPQGNCMLIGVGGCGKQTLTKLAAYIAHCDLFCIQVTKDYKHSMFREEVKNLYLKTGGLDGKRTVFLMNDSQIIQESFLEDINNILNTGEVPNLFTKEELEVIENDLRPLADKKKVYDVYSFFLSRVKENLHVVLCMSPIGDTLRVRMRMFPSLVNCCTINWVDSWPEDALLSVSKKRFEDFSIEDIEPVNHKKVKSALTEIVVKIQSAVQTVAEEFDAELKRKVYVTPKSFLDMIKLYFRLLDEKKFTVTYLRDRYMKGVNKLVQTNLEVAKMQENLTSMAPVLEHKKIEAERLAVAVEADSIAANEVKELALADEREVNMRTKEIMRLQEDAEADLRLAMPALESAIKALDQINSKDIAEIRTFPNPPALVVYTLEAIAIALEQKTDWDSIKRILQNNFIDTLKTFPKDNIKPATLKKLRTKISTNPNFTPEKVGTVNTASRSLCQWVFAIENYAKIAKEVEPKKQHLERMNRVLWDAQDNLQRTQARLNAELEKVQALERSLNEVILDRDKLDEEIKRTHIRLERASVLTEGLRDEHKRWEETAQKLSTNIIYILGDVLLSAACINYSGPFTGIYRKKLVAAWSKLCAEFGIAVSSRFDLCEVMADELSIRHWQILGLPSDEVSLQNAIIVTKNDKYPLLIDPQEQACKWIKNMESKRNLKLAKQTDRDFARTLESCIRNGVPMLVEEVNQTLHPLLSSAVSKNIIEQTPGVYLMSLGEAEIEYDSNFMLYMTTKLFNPYFKPEDSMRLSIINFTVTLTGLQEQLLADVVKHEEPNLEKEKMQILITIAQYQKRLKDIEDKILKSLNDTKGHILDDAALIENLRNSKIVSEEITSKMATSEITKKGIEEAREKYSVVANRGAMLYFVIADLPQIDPMYQFSLGYFTKLFNSVINSSPKSSNLQERLSILDRNITDTIYNNVCRGLFNTHKLIFSFMIGLQVLYFNNKMTREEVYLLFRGVSLIPPEFITHLNPAPSVFSEKAWDMVICLQNTSRTFSYPYLAQCISQDIPAWTQWMNSPDIYKTDPPVQFRDFSPFQRLALIRAVREDRFIDSLIEFVIEVLGERFIMNTSSTIEEIYNDSDSTTPIIFILSQGADPMAMIQRLTHQMKFEDKIDIISLGKGQGERARRIIEKAMKAGSWVLLQNCHLSRSWMPELEKLVIELSETKSLNSDFRLILTSLPCDYFPVSVLQNGIKITDEPPKGIKANLKRSISSLNPDRFEYPTHPEEFKKLLTSLCFFHAIVQERRKFGPLGWNIRYEFNETDLDTSISVLSSFMEEAAIPWDAIKFIIGEIVYGGRVTDEWDRRTIKEILSTFIGPETIEEDYSFSSSGIYKLPQPLSISSMQQYIETLPITDEPEIFGMHDNANITLQAQEREFILQTCLANTPKDRGVANKTKQPDHVVDDLANLILANIPSPLMMSEAGSNTFPSDAHNVIDAQATFLKQEIQRFNRLLILIKKTLEDLKKALKGQVIMSEDLDLMYTAFMNNKVPTNWSNIAYPSLKPLASWVSDLRDRVSFLRQWLTRGKPATYWLSAFFFPQGFLTAVLQSYSRKYQVPIDSLNFSYEIQSFSDHHEIEGSLEEGVYIYGLFMQGCRWDYENMMLEESHPGESFSIAPVILFEPSDHHETEPEDYIMPIYKTTERAGTLSTTGHSTNYIISIECPTSQKTSHWVLRGAAFICQLND